MKTWLAAHPRFELHFTSTSSSWLNLARAGSPSRRPRSYADGAHRCVRDLNTDIRVWIDTWNDDPKPYVWTKTADQILYSIAGYCNRINESRY